MHAPLYMCVFTARHRTQDLWLCFFSLLRAMTRIYPLTVRDENAGRAQRTASTLQLSQHSLQTNGVAGGDDDDAYRTFCRQSERRNTVA
jgi:hypothetical protein